jgi:sec-independent protein translocase protein TatB
VFDIGFAELLLCMVIALVVIGPEQLPGTVRTIGLWIGRLKRSLRETRSEIERQIGADDIRRQLHNEEIMHSLEQTRQAMENSIKAGETEGEKLLNADEEERPKKRIYGPPEELPDHAHMDENPPSIVPSLQTPVDDAIDTAADSAPTEPTTPKP